MLDVVALGELLVDFTPMGYSVAGNEIFEANPGGAPANVLAALSNLGGKGAFIGKVGNDCFGYFLKKVLEDNHIDVSGLKFSNDANTTLAFVHLDSKGDRSFSFYRKPGADTTLKVEDLDFRIIDDAKIFHFGSISMTDEPARTATLTAVEHARKKGKIISYDPNWRPPLWQSDDLAREWMSAGLKYADILKLSEIELEFLTCEKYIEKGSDMLFNMGIKLVAVTLGPKGCFYKCTAGSGFVNTFDTKVIDTTGAGDAFLGALLYRTSRLETGLEAVNKKQIEDIIEFSNAAGALCTTKRGAIPAMPHMHDIESCIRNIPKLKAR